jgi:hypothetical protein
MAKPSRKTFRFIGMARELQARQKSLQPGFYCFLRTLLQALPDRFARRPVALLGES